jgi:hypothetical protein
MNKMFIIRECIQIGSSFVVATECLTAVIISHSFRSHRRIIHVKNSILGLKITKKKSKVFTTIKIQADI